VRTWIAISHPLGHGGEAAVLPLAVRAAGAERLGQHLRIAEALALRDHRPGVRQVREVEREIMADQPVRARQHRRQPPRVDAGGTDDEHPVRCGRQLH
jgi:hypothetical protein